MSHLFNVHHLLFVYMGDESKLHVVLLQLSLE